MKILFEDMGLPPQTPPSFFAKKRSKKWRGEAVRTFLLSRRSAAKRAWFMNKCAAREPRPAGDVKAKPWRVPVKKKLISLGGGADISLPLFLARQP